MISERPRRVSEFAERECREYRESIESVESIESIEGIEGIERASESDRVSKRASERVRESSSSELLDVASLPLAFRQVSEGESE